MASMELTEHSSTFTHMAATLCCTPCRASALVGMLRNSAAPTAAYATMAAVEALAAVACEPGARTTDPILRHALLSEVGALGRPLFALFNHPASALLPMPLPNPAKACTRCFAEIWGMASKFGSWPLAAMACKRSSCGEAPAEASVSGQIVFPASRASARCGSAPHASSGGGRHQCSCSNERSCPHRRRHLAPPICGRVQRTGKSLHS